jgi:Ricin-type beta-trefoil lectin domain-like
MGDKIISDGTYTLMGPGGQLTMPAQRMGPGSIIILPPSPSDKAQQWAVKSDSDGYRYSLQNVATGSYLGSDDNGSGPVMVLNGAQKPVNWVFAEGPDDDPNSFILLSIDSGGGMVLAPSPLRIYPPQLAIRPQFDGYPFEWTFAQVG